MCRWLAYSGPPILLDQMIAQPVKSLIHQSHDAEESKSTINADGFGIGWYGEHLQPGVFRDVLPAWNDNNLLNLCEQVRSRLFFGHVRASTGSAINRANCHPFRFQNWLFMHNGQIGGFRKLRRDLTLAIQPDLFTHLEGSTDSELIFLLALGHGLQQNPAQAFQKTIEQIRALMKKHSITSPLRVTAAASDGENIYALRYSNDPYPPSLYYACETKNQSETSCLVLSEPLDHTPDHWIEVPPSSLLVSNGGEVQVTPFKLAD